MNYCSKLWINQRRLACLLDIWWLWEVLFKLSLKLRRKYIQNCEYIKKMRHDISLSGKLGGSEKSRLVLWPKAFLFTAASRLLHNIFKTVKILRNWDTIFLFLGNLVALKKSRLVLWPEALLFSADSRFLPAILLTVASATNVVCFRLESVTIQRKPLRSHWTKKETSDWAIKGVAIFPANSSHTG